jgi:hypothetical protein
MMNNKAKEVSGRGKSKKADLTKEFEDFKLKIQEF